MGTFGNFIEVAAGLAYGFMTEAARQSAAHDDPGAIDRLCAQAGWTVDERSGTAAVLHFTDPFVGVRKLMASAAGDTLTLSTSSAGVFPAVPHAVAEYMLARNARLVVGAWSTITIRQGVALFLIHRSPLGGMTGEAFRFACEAIAHEAHDLDAKLTDAGLLS